jgi:ABC-type multidrug transport system fused ATPase/permease subunit
MTIMEILRIPIGKLEQPMTLRWCLVFLSALSFLDCYLILRFQTSISTISISWIKNNIKLSEAFLLIAAFSITFSVVIKAVGWLMVLLFGGWLFSLKYWLYKKITKSEKGFYAEQNSNDKFYKIYELKRKAINENSSVLYSEILQREVEVHDSQFLSYMSQSLITMLAVGWVYDGGKYPSIIANYEKLSSEVTWYNYVLLSTFVSFFFLFVISMAFEKRKFESYIAIEKVER